MAGRGPEQGPDRWIIARQGKQVINIILPPGADVTLNISSALPSTHTITETVVGPPEVRKRMLTARIPRATNMYLNERAKKDGIEATGEGDDITDSDIGVSMEGYNLRRLALNLRNLGVEKSAVRDMIRQTMRTKNFGETQTGIRSQFMLTVELEIDSILDEVWPENSTTEFQQPGV